jgi:hypothetical protein
MSLGRHGGLRSLGMLAAVLAATSGGLAQAAQDKAVIPAVASVAGSSIGLPWRWGKSNGSTGHGGKRPKVGRGRSQMSRKRRRREHRRSWS